MKRDKRYLYRWETKNGGNNAAKCSLKWDVQYVQCVPIVVTRSDGTFPLQSKLQPEQSLLLSVNCQRFHLYSHFNERRFLLTRHVRSLDDWSSLTGQPKKKPANYVSSSYKAFTLECHRTSCFCQFHNGTGKLGFVNAILADITFFYFRKSFFP